MPETKDEYNYSVFLFLNVGVFFFSAGYLIYGIVCVLC